MHDSGLFFSHTSDARQSIVLSQSALHNKSCLNADFTIGSNDMVDELVPGDGWMEVDCRVFGKTFILFTTLAL